MTAPPFTISSALPLSVGRSTVLESSAEQQLCPHGGTLTNQLARLYDEVGTHLTALVGTTPDLPPRKPHRWTILSEHEHPGWSLLALSRPPVINSADTLLFVRHLATAHIAMEPARCREWARQTHDRDGYEPLRRALLEAQQGTWAGLLTAILTVQAQHAMLHGWGVLSAHVGLHTELKVASARQILQAITHAPELLHDSRDLAATTLWATLSLLHGGLPRPAHEEVGQVARTLRTLPERTVTAPLPNPRKLYAQLQQWLPHLSEEEFSSMADFLYGKQPGDTQTTLRHSSGQTLTSTPGHSAFWLRRAGQVQVVTATQTPGSALDVRAWHWNL